MLNAAHYPFFKIRPVLLAGGAGCRVKHLSATTALPKQFHKLDNGAGLSLVEATLLRVVNFDYFQRPYIFTHSDYKSYLNSPYAQIFYEPTRRNTFMPILAAAILAQKAGDEVMLVLPCDHIIRNQDAFNSNILSGAALAHTLNKIVYCGIVPDNPDTQFGYIVQSDDEKVSFHEKPASCTAATLIERGALWNSGIFLIPVDRFLNDIHSMAPDLYTLALQQNLNTQNLSAELWEAGPDISFDRFYCERITDGILISADFDWCDIGAPERYLKSGIAAA